MARPGFTSHWKFRALCDALDLPEPYVLGLMEMVWVGCYEAGDDTLGNRHAVERAARWPGSRGAFAEAVINCGLVDEDKNSGVCRVHDLLDHAPSYVAKRMQREAERQAKGVTLREIRSEAGKRGHAAMLASMSANGTHLPSNGKPLDRHVPRQVTGTPAPAPSGEDSREDPREDRTEDGSVGQGPKRALSPQQQRVKDAEDVIFRKRGVLPPPAASIAAWLKLVDEMTLDTIVSDLEASGKLGTLEGQGLTAYIFGCVKKAVADCSALERRAGIS